MRIAPPAEGILEAGCRKNEALEGSTALHIGRQADVHEETLCATRAAYFRPSSANAWYRRLRRLSLPSFRSSSAGECVAELADNRDVTDSPHSPSVAPPGLAIPAPDCTADNGLHGRLIVSAPLPVARISDPVERHPCHGPKKASREPAQP
jgi:hypothetical protein